MYGLERQMAELDDEEEKLVAEIEATSQEIDKVLSPPPSVLLAWLPG